MWKLADWRQSQSVTKPPPAAPRARPPAGGPAVKNGNGNHSQKLLSALPSRWPPPPPRICNPQEPKATTAGRPAGASRPAAPAPSSASKRPQRSHGTSGTQRPAHPRPRAAQGPKRGPRGGRPIAPRGGRHHIARPKNGNCPGCAADCTRGRRCVGGFAGGAVGGAVAEGRRPPSQVGALCGKAVLSTRERSEGVSVWRWGRELFSTYVDKSA